MESTEWLLSPLFPGRIGIWKCWFLWREDNRSTRRKTLGAGTRTNNKLNPPITPRPGIEPGPHWWEASALTTGPSLLPSLNGHGTTSRSDLKSSPSSTLSSSLKLQYSLASSSTCSFSEGQSFITYSITTLQVSSVLKVSLNLFSVFVSNPSPSIRFTLMIPSGSLTGSVSVRGALLRQSEMTCFFPRNITNIQIILGKFPQHPL